MKYVGPMPAKASKAIDLELNSLGDRQPEKHIAYRTGVMCANYGQQNVRQYTPSIHVMEMHR